MSNALLKDTLVGVFPEACCSDCGKKECSYEHWGSLILSGEVVGYFCLSCLKQREERAKSKRPPLPLGINFPGISAGLK